MSRTLATATVACYFALVLICATLARGATLSTLHHREHRQMHTLHRYHGTVRFFRHHPRLARTAVGRREIRKARIWLRVTARELRETRLALTPRVIWPPHHLLWLCIHSGEGRWNDPNSGGNGHYGGLQMTPGWGDLPTGATADHLSQLDQEWLAEREGAKYGFASWWLYQQWGADARCF